MRHPRGFAFLSLVLSFFCVALSANQEFIRFDEHGHYAGLSDYAKNLIAQSRDTLRRRKEVFSKKFKQFDAIYHAAHVNRLARGNMFLFGPPGGAKSAFSSWLFSHELEPAFKLQMHQMMTEQAFVGGQNMNKAREGLFEINTQGSLVDFKVALVDELDKGNPAALAALLSLLNEREVLIGNKAVKAKLETLLSTSNANRYEIFEQFAENGMRSTAAALLNRFTTSAFVPNWLAKADQAAIDQEYLASFDTVFNRADGETTVADEKLTLDWEALRKLAYYLLRPNEEFFSVSREFVDALRAKTIEAVQEKVYETSEDTLPYFPTAEFTERLRQRIHEIIIMSVFLDFLTSRVADDIPSLENALKLLPHHRFEISPLSLWRAYLSITTVTAGKVALRYPTKDAAQDLSIDFGSVFRQKSGVTAKPTYKAKDKREEQEIIYALEEQDRFNRLFVTTMNNHKQVLEDSASFGGMFSCLLGDCVINKNLQDVERLLMAFGS